MMAEPPTIITGANPIFKYPKVGATIQMAMAIARLAFCVSVKFCIIKYFLFAQNYFAAMNRFFTNDK
ncbi:MAG: hypothetical protein BWZ05_02295 [Bacteroidetes bacterium ADurb.BinA245]|nr:MAG: hypothetical protein BWZ05_02295 [Bacteroidetes bacterium ADurb.BinA245]